jgi:ABC-type multidrug transport system ATPase subunit
MLSLTGVTLGYRHVTVLRDVDITFGVGTTALLGVNGAGKTSLFRSACGVHRPSVGSVRVQGADPYARATRRAALGHVALIPQFLEFPRHLRLLDFLAYMAMIRAVPRRERKAACESALAQVGLADRRSARLGSLSGGMLKRASIAQALLTSPPILLCDEPTVGLDPEQRASIRELVKRLATDRCVVVASHIVEDASYLADRVVVLHDQGVAFDGRPQQLSARDAPGDFPDDDSVGSTLERAFLRIVREASTR